MYVKDTIFLFQKQNYISFEDCTSWGDPIAKYEGDFSVLFYSKQYILDQYEILRDLCEVSKKFSDKCWLKQDVQSY